MLGVSRGRRGLSSRVCYGKEVPIGSKPVELNRFGRAGFSRDCNHRPHGLFKRLSFLSHAWPQSTLVCLRSVVFLFNLETINEMGVVRP